MPMRPLHWARLPDAQVNNTLWREKGFDDANARIDTAAFEQVFGIVPKDAGEHPSPDALHKKPSKTQLLDQQRSQNVAIALKRLKLSNDRIKESISDPARLPLTPDQLTALLSIMPTDDEVQLVREYHSREELEAPELFFLALSTIPRVAPRLQAILCIQHFDGQASSFLEDVKSVIAACAAVRKSTALTKTLELVLALGNHLNGTGPKGGAYGFKLSELAKLVDVKSGDHKTTLLHYIASLMAPKNELADFEAIGTLKAELDAVSSAASIALADKKTEATQLKANFDKVKLQRDAGSSDDPLQAQLIAFCSAHEARVKQIQGAVADAEKCVKDLAQWLADKPSATAAELFGPLAAFARALENAHRDNAKKSAAAGAGKWKMPR